MGLYDTNDLGQSEDLWVYMTQMICVIWFSNAIFNVLLYWVTFRDASDQLSITSSGARWFFLQILDCAEMQDSYS